MDEGFSLGLVVALIGGALFAVVTAFEGYMSKNVGAVNASLLEHTWAGVISIIVLTWVVFSGKIDISVVKNIWPAVVGGGTVILVGVAAIAYAIPRTGLAVGNFAIVLAQILVAVVIDAIGVGGYERIPVSLPRIFGLLLMAAGLFVIIPRN